ncbi:MAG: THUMP domain-containing protein [Desulfurococcales archaeon]|nr:THUMP domain-containing protein [Desulfurococcales archaeon]
MEDVVLVRYSEIAVKGRHTRRRMEELLVEGIRELLSRSGVEGEPHRVDGRVIVYTSRPREASKAISRVFGVKSLSPAVEAIFRDLEDLVEAAYNYFKDRVRGRIFRVRARRAGSHSFTSKDVERLLGARLMEAGARGVDLEAPEYTAYVEIRGERLYMYDEVLPGPGGLPLGSEDPVLVLFSGGFDSTVAAWRAMRRGSRAYLLYYDMGVEEARDNAVEAASRLMRLYAYGYKPKLYIVGFRGVAMIARSSIRPEYQLLAIRRYMMEHATSLARRMGIEAIVTGESVGQVASQTIRNLYLISSGLDIAILRPLAGSDKDEIMEEARRIGLYDIVSRQIEVCGRAPTPTPRGNPETFWREYEKIRGTPVPEPVEVPLL